MKKVEGKFRRKKWVGRILPTILLITTPHPVILNEAPAK